MLESSPHALARITRVRSWATPQQRWHRAVAGSPPPGDHGRHACLVGSYRCVFYLAERPHGVYRHLRISLPGGQRPGNHAVWTLATWFGYTGGNRVRDLTLAPGSDWWIGWQALDRCVTVMQPLSAEEIEAALRLPRS